MTLADGTRSPRSRDRRGRLGRYDDPARRRGFDQQDLGPEVDWRRTRIGRVAGPRAAGLGTVPRVVRLAFSQGRQLTVGVIMSKGRGAETKRICPVSRAAGPGRPDGTPDSGHLTRCRAAACRCARAGCWWPATRRAARAVDREGISYAIRSGSWAGEVAARGDLDRYPRLSMSTSFQR